jgi:hypothetical protein
MAATLAYLLAFSCRAAAPEKRFPGVAHVLPYVAYLPALSVHSYVPRRIVEASTHPVHVSRQWISGIACMLASAVRHVHPVVASPSRSARR